MPVPSRALVGLAAAALLGVGATWAWRFVQPDTTTSAPAPMASAVPAPAYLEAYVELAVATSSSEAELAVWQDRRKLAPLVATFTGGGAAVSAEYKRFAELAVRDDQVSSFEVMSAERYILPPASDGELVAPQLTPSERARFFASRSVLVIRLRGTGGPPHWPYRTGFGLAAALAEQLDGFVDDEVRRRVETAALVKARATPLETGSAFTDQSITVELDPDADASDHGRLLTLGQKRFGAPDLELRDVPAAEAEPLARGLTVLARMLATRPPAEELTVRPSDFREGAAGPAAVVRLVPAELAAGNPENELLEVRIDAATRARWLRELGLTEEGALHADSPDEFAARVHAVKLALPAVTARWKHEHGTLFVLVDFPAPPAGVESMWVQVDRFDGARLRGTLSNEPAHATALHHGQLVDVPVPVISGYRLELPSGERISLP